MANHIVSVLSLLFLWTNYAMAQEENFIWFQQEMEPTQRSGIIFEKLQNITFSQDYRNVTIMLDLAIREKAIDNLEFAFRQLRVMSGHNVPENFSTFGPHFEDLYEKFQDVKEAILQVKSLKEMPNTMSEGKLIQNRMKKNTYDLSKPQTFEKGGSIFLDSALSKKMKELIMAKETIYYNIHDLPAVKNNSSKLVKEQYTTQLFTTLIEMQEYLYEHLENFKAIKISLLSIKEHKLWPGLIEYEALRQIEKYFDTYYRTCKFPVINITNAAELNQWIETSFGTDKDQVYFEIQIPCVNEKRIQLYGVKPMPTPQKIDENASSAYIEPRTPYLLTEGDSHYHASYEEIQECKHGNKLIICPAQWFVFQDQDSCESSLLIHPDKTDYSTCRIVYQREHQDYMTLLKSTGNVLYALSKPNIVQYQYRDGQGNATLDGVGLLKIRDVCNIEFKGMSIQGTFTEADPNNRLILPKKVLNVAELTQIFAERGTKAIFEELNQEEGNQYFWEVEREAREIAREKYLQNIYQTALISYAVVIAVVIIVVFITSGIIIYFKYVYEYEVEEDSTTSSYVEAEKVEMA